MLTVALALLVLPAMSVAFPLAVCPAPSCVKLTGAAQLATPESASVHEKLTVTLELFHPKLLASGLSVAAIVGGVLSMLTLVLGTAVFPALSVAVPGRPWFAPSVLTNAVAGHEATPDKLSAQLNDAVTLVLFQPAAFGNGESAVVIVGGVLSMLTVLEVLAVFPATSTAVPETL